VFDPTGVAAAIEHGLHVGSIAGDLVINGKREGAGKEAVGTVDLSVNSRVKHQGINVGEE